MNMARMKDGICDASLRGSGFSRTHRAALLVICVVLFVVLGIAVPYKTYKYFTAKQDAAVVSVLHEEL